MSDTNLVGSILNKAREIAESDAVTGAVGRVRDAAANTGIREIYEKGAQRAKSFGNAAKLTVDLNRDLKELDRVYLEIGKLCYEQAKDAPDGSFAPLFAQAASLQTAIAAKKAEIEQYKASFEPGETQADSGLDGQIADFEAIVNQTENDGSST